MKSFPGRSLRAAFVLLIPLMLPLAERAQGPSPAPAGMSSTPGSSDSIGRRTVTSIAAEPVNGALADAASNAAALGLVLVGLVVVLASTDAVLRSRPTSTVALAWPAARTTPAVEAFIGIVRGRTPNSSRG